MVWSSLICFGFGLVHLAGVYGQWPTLSQAPQSTPPADFISPSPNVQRAELSLEECLATGGRVRGDIGDGAIHAPDFVCESSGQPPIGIIRQSSDGAMAIEGAVCCAE